MVAKALLLESQGYKIYEVDGAEVREDFSVTFAHGENWQHNAKLPKNEVWLEAGQAHEDRCYICLHELVEATLMDLKGLDYDEAHVLANTIEAFARKTSDIPEALGVLAEAAEVPEAAIKKINGCIAELQASKKEAAEGTPVWEGGTPQMTESPKALGGDPYENYISGAMGSPSRRGNVFDLATGTRWKGLRGIKERMLTGIGEYGAMSDAGISYGDKDFPQRMAGAVHKHFETPGAVEGVFGRQMGTLEAIKTLGVSDLVHARTIASDPMTWSKAFGKAARTPAEQAQAKKFLHAALSLNAQKKSLGFDKNKAALMWAGIPTSVQRASKLNLVPRDTSSGTKMLPSIKDLMGQQVLNPKYFTDNQEAARLMAKMSSEEEPRAKIAAELQGLRTAKHLKDPEDHLYHVEKRDGVTVGMVKVAPKNSGAQYHITNFWVKPGMRSQGIGKALFSRLIELYGDHELTLDSEVFDKSPLTQAALDKFYEKHGFTKGEGLRMTRPAGGPQEKAASFSSGEAAQDQQNAAKSVAALKAVGRGLDGLPLPRPAVATRAPATVKKGAWLRGMFKAVKNFRTPPGTKALRSLPPPAPIDTQQILDGLRIAKQRRYAPWQARETAEKLRLQGLQTTAMELETPVMGRAFKRAPLRGTPPATQGTQQ